MLAQGPPGDETEGRPDVSRSPIEPPGNETSGRRPLLIYTAELHLAVFEAGKAIAGVEALAKKLGGYLVRRSDTSIVVRVPAEKFESALAGVAGLGDELSRNVQAEDITEAFRDLEVRLQNLEAVRRRFEELLARASNVEEALAVERQLERVTGEMERIKGRLKLFRELLSFSTVTVHLQPRAVDRVESDFELPFPWLRELGLGRLLSL
jgi:hypothetical protein